MANNAMSIGEVKSVCKSMELSPSKSAKQSPLRAGGSKAQAKGAKATSKMKGLKRKKTSFG